MENKEKEVSAMSLLIDDGYFSGLSRGQKLCREKEEGNREYKFKLTGLSDEQRNHRATQLHWRLNEGNDTAVYLIGVEDDGNQLGISEDDLKESLRNLKFMADQVGCEMSIKQLFAGEQGVTAEVHMRRLTRLTVDTCQVNVAVAGDLDAGKSTLIGVLSTGKLDNGRGLARMQVFRHNHEVESGRTSCISHHVIHFDDNGQILNSDPLGGCSTKTHRLRAFSDIELANESSRAVTLIDLAGHAKYLKTTLHGLVGRKLDYCLACIALSDSCFQMMKSHNSDSSFNNSSKTNTTDNSSDLSDYRTKSNNSMDSESSTCELQSMTVEHLNISLYLKIPILFAITKLDLLSKSTAANKNHPRIAAIIAAIESFFHKHNQLQQHNHQHSEQVRCQVIETPTQLVDVLMSMSHHHSYGRHERVVPIFLVSSVTGSGLQLLRSCLFQLHNPSPITATRRQLLQHDNEEGSYDNEEVLVRLLGTISSGDSDLEVEGNPPTYQTPLTQSNASHSDWQQLLEEEEEEEYYCNNRSNNRKKESKREKKESRKKDKKDRKKLATSKDSSSSSSPDAPPIPAAFASPVAKAAAVPLLVTGADVTVFTPARTPPLHPSAPLPSPQSPPAVFTGKVLIALVQRGQLTVGQALQLGPLSSAGTFQPVTVHSLRLNNVPIRCAAAGQTVTLTVRGSPTPLPSPSAGDELSENLNSTGSSKMKSTDSQLPRHLSSNNINSIANSTASNLAGVRRQSVKGMVLLSPSCTLAERSHFMFEAELHILNSKMSTTINVNYEPVVHVGCVNQSAKLMSFVKLPAQKGNEDWKENADEVGTLTNGDKALCRFKFLYFPEFLEVGSAMIIREHLTKGVGVITKLL